MKNKQSYFTIAELSLSSTALKLLIDNTPSELVIVNLTALVDNILDPLRHAYGKSIRVNSGYRSLALNRFLAGAASSQHMTGEAADITAGNATQNKILFDLILSLNLPFDQLIDEKNYKWIHVSYNPKRNRKQILHLK